MHSSLIAVVLCICAQASVACISETEAAQQTAAPIQAHTIKTQPTSAALASTGLITTAAAGTRDAPVVRAAPRVAAAADEEHPRRGGTAMLLAALALMSGIALRRYGAGSQ